MRLCLRGAHQLLAQAEDALPGGAVIKAPVIVLPSAIHPFISETCVRVNKKRSEITKKKPWTDGCASPVSPPTYSFTNQSENMLPFRWLKR